MEAAAEAFDVVFVDFALAAKDLGDDAGGAEDIGEIFLQEAVLVHEEVEDFERLGAGKLVVAVLEILDQEVKSSASSFSAWVSFLLRRSIS